MKDWKGLGFQGAIHIGLIVVYWSSLILLGSAGLKNLNELNGLGMLGLVLNRICAFAIPVQAWYAARKSPNQAVAGGIRGYAVADLITSILSTIAIFFPVPPILSLTAFIIASVLFGSWVGWRRRNSVTVTTQRISLTDVELGEIVGNVYQWNAGKWTSEAIRAMFNLPKHHWILFTAVLKEQSIGYLLMAFDTPGQRIQLPIERVFPEMVNAFEREVRVEAVFTIVDPQHRQHHVFRKLMARAFWPVVFSVRAAVGVAEVEEEKISLYKQMGLPIYKVFETPVEYMGGACYPSAIDISWRNLAEGLVAVLVTGSPRLFRKQ